MQSNTRALRPLFTAVLTLALLLASCATTQPGSVSAASPSPVAATASATPAPAVAALATTPASPAAGLVLKVACVGDSITYGYGLDRATESYPVLLQDLLGTAGWQVRNFGQNSTTVIRRGDVPYMKQKIHAESLAFNPDVVVIMLGTNDTKYINFQYSDDFVPDYEALVASYASLPSKPRIFIATPAWVVGEGNWGINNECLVDEQLPLILDLAKRLDLTVVDIHTATQDQPDLFLEDNVHPGAKGAGLIARTVWQVLADQEAQLRRQAVR